jgi:hypothetical protein
MTTPKTFGILGPQIHPEHYAIQDSRIAASWYEYTLYVVRLAKERPELVDRFFIDEERLTKH